MRVTPGQELGTNFAAFAAKFLVSSLAKLIDVIVDAGGFDSLAPLPVAYLPAGGFLGLTPCCWRDGCKNGAAGKNRTYDPALTKGVLYP